MIIQVVFLIFCLEGNLKCTLHTEQKIDEVGTGNTAAY